jgi:hypothetical protein
MGWNNTTLTAGSTYALIYVYIVDTDERVGGQLFDAPADRLILGDQFKDYTI